MKRFIYIIVLTFFVILPAHVSAVGGETYGIFSSEVAPPSNPLPSDVAMDRIQQLTEPRGQRELRDKPGGGPGLGELIVPVPSFEKTDLLIMPLLYIGFVILRRKGIIKRGTEVN
jgi:hypothetical protein